jgi:hypothetical protein
VRCRTVAFALLASLLFVAVAATAQPSDLDRFQKSLGRHAASGSPFDKAPKQLCRCNTGILLAAPVAGWVTQAVGLPGDPNRVYLRCAVPVFDGAGALDGINYCSDWDPL